MKKTKLTRSLLAACSIVALSVVLSGCLHSSGDGPAYSELDLTGYDTADGATVEADTYSTDGLPSALVSALEGYTGPTTAEAGGVLTIGSYTFTCGADSSCSVTVAPDGSHFTTTGTITVMKMAEPEPEPDTTTPTSTDVDANMALAMAIDTADDATADTTDDAALLNLDTAVALVSDGMPAATSELTESDMVIADLGSGWSGSAYGKTTAAEGTTPASTDTVVIYNNKGADETVGYLTHYGVAANLPTGVTLTAATGVMAFEANRLGSHPGLVTLMDVTKVTKYDDDLDDTDDVGSTVEGTFQGIAGLFTCTDSAGCEIAPLAGGGYATDGTWSFAPTLDSSDTTALANLKVTVDDRDYMHFGYWVQTSTDAEGDPTATVNGFFGGTMASTTALVTARATSNATATYAGPASGVYVLKTFDAQGTGTAAASGQFTATANLTAYFGTGDNTVAGAKQNSVEGTVTGFMANGAAIPGKWSLDLNTASHGGTAVTFSGTTQETGNDDGAMGAWRGGFFGGMEDDTATTTVDEEASPSGVAGEFTGHFTNGHVLGGFGASLVKDSEPN